MIFNLPHRSLVRLSGAEASNFLNDLMTASIPDEGVCPAALLTPQGRVLFDLLVCREGDDILLELDGDRRDEFIKKMTMYRLRRDVDITSDERFVHACSDQEYGGEGLVLLDARFPRDTFRIYSLAPLDGEDVEAWKAFRYEQGVAEGFFEIPPEKALPLEARLDLDGGIDFDKGCYIGQEVTARTRYRGLVKRCYLPVRLPQTAQIPQNILAGEKLVGEIFDLASDEEGAIGMAAIRLDALEGKLTLDNGDAVTPHYPERLLPLPSRKK